MDYARRANATSPHTITRTSDTALHPPRAALLFFVVEAGGGVEVDGDVGFAAAMKASPVKVGVGEEEEEVEEVRAGRQVMSTPVRLRGGLSAARADAKQSVVLAEVRVVL